MFRDRRIATATGGIYMRKLFNERAEIETSNRLSASRRRKRKEGKKENVLATLATLH